MKHSRTIDVKLKLALVCPGMNLEPLHHIWGRESCFYRVRLYFCSSSHA